MNARRPFGIRTERGSRRAAMLSALLVASSMAAEAFADGTQASAKAPAPEISPDSSRTWSFGGLILGYWMPDENSYLQPTITADSGALHLEARYQYEALETGSVWLGYNLSGAGQVSWELTPMLGGVVGETMGVATGLRGSLGWWRLELSAETEWVFDADEISDSFVYTWSELRVIPADGWHLGIALQRTRIYQSDREIELGPLAGIAIGHFELTLYAFELDRDPMFIVAVSASY